jgi:hypothetical protein
LDVLDLPETDKAGACLRGRGGGYRLDELDEDGIGGGEPEKVFESSESSSLEVESGGVVLESPNFVRTRVQVNHFGDFFGRPPPLEKE